jgi:hypothetical protein
VLVETYFYYVYLYVLVLAISIFEAHMFWYTTPNTTLFFALLVLQMKGKHHTQAALSKQKQIATYTELTKAVGLVGASWIAGSVRQSQRRRPQLKGVLPPPLPRASKSGGCCQRRQHI